MNRRNFLKVAGGTLATTVLAIGTPLSLIPTLIPTTTAKNPYVRTCLICKKEYTLDEEMVDYLFGIGMMHPFISCRECAVKQVADMHPVAQDDLIRSLGTPKGRERYWERLAREFGREVPS